MNARKQSGFGCLTLFGLPFLATGLITFYLLIQELLAGTGDWERLLLLVVFPPTFGGVGLGLMIADRWGRRRIQNEEQLKQLHPDEPWRWNPDWTDGRLRGSGRRTMWFAWGFAGLWNLISAPLLFLLPRVVLEEGNYAALIGLLFPLVGAGLLFWAVKVTLRQRKYGLAEFEMTTFPGVIGGRLRGTVHSGLKQAPPAGARVTLTSIHRTVTGSGDDRKVNEDIKWQDDYVLAPTELVPGRHGLAFPIDFIVPHETPPSDPTRDDDNRHLWRLDVDAETPGVDFHSQFEVPVFVTADSSESVTAASLDRDPPPGARQAYDPAASKIRIRDSALGGKEFYFPAARNKTVAIGLTIFLLIFGGATAGLLLWGMDDAFSDVFDIFFLLLPLGFGFFTLLLLVFALDAWTGTTRVVIEDGRLRVRSTVLGMGGWKEVPCNQIRDIKLGIGMQQKQTMTQAAKAYYDIEVHPEFGKRIKAGSGIRDKREAQWLVDQMSLAVLEAG